MKQYFRRKNNLLYKIVNYKINIERKLILCDFKQFLYESHFNEVGPIYCVRRNCIKVNTILYVELDY